MAAPMTYIKDLPDELLLEILDDAPTSDVLRFRQTSRALLPASTTVLRQRLKVLYIHPSRSSLRSAVAICYSDLSAEIEEVYLIGKTPWQEIRKANDKFWQHFAGRTRAGRRSAILDYFPWPAQRRKLKLGTKGISTEQARISERSNTAGHFFAKAYIQLLEALAKLRKVSKLTFASSRDISGFNKTSQDNIESYAAKSCQD